MPLHSYQVKLYLQVSVCTNEHFSMLLYNHFEDFVKCDSMEAANAAKEAMKLQLV